MMDREVPEQLARLMERWEALRKELDQVEDEIRRIVLDAAQSFRHGNVIAAYSSGRGKYDYEQIARELQVPDHVVARFTKIVVDWRAVCEEVGIPASLKEKYYTPGIPTVNIRFV